MKTTSAFLLLLALSLSLAQCNNVIHDLIPWDEAAEEGDGLPPPPPPPPSYTVRFDKNGGTTDASPAAKTVIPPATTVDALPTTDPTWATPPHAFEGWWTKNGYGGNWGTEFTASTPVTANITVYARWDPPPVYYTVTFNKNNSDPGSTEADPSTRPVAEGAGVNPLPKQPVRLGYAFVGWNRLANGSGAAFTESTPVTANITVYAQWNLLPQYFTFTVRTTGANETFAIPTSGRLNGGSNPKSYAWNIDWGDTQSETVSGASSDTSAGIQHIYSAAGDYRITITPGGSIDAWLGAFGFYADTGGANGQANKNKVISVDSPLTLLMTRTQAEITAGTAPNNEWEYTFYECKNPAFTMGANFKFAAEWDTITTVGDFFANQMFADCSGAAFTMNSNFNLPTGITTVGINFAAGLFQTCSGAAFTMNSGFNLPPLITTVGGGFAYCMFSGCSGAAFTMNNVFNLPQGITTVGINFAFGLFQACSGAAFTMNSGFNLPPLITTGDYGFAHIMFNSCNGAAFTMNGVFNLPQGITTVGDWFATAMFAGCNGTAFNMNSVFNLPPLITTVGTYFAETMFNTCSGAAFNMNGVFNLPQGITTVGDWFAHGMFFSCNGAAFTMNGVFNLPPGIITVGDYFAHEMFNWCYGAAFNMNGVFNLPQGITTVDEWFATTMFRLCAGPSFQVNSVFTFPVLSQAELDKGGVFSGTFENVATQTRSAASIINGNPNPSSLKGTFYPSGVWTDYGSIHANWK